MNPSDQLQAGTRNPLNRKLNVSQRQLGCSSKERNSFFQGIKPGSSSHYSDRATPAHFYVESCATYERKLSCYLRIEKVQRKGEISVIDENVTISENRKIIIRDAFKYRDIYV
jgi:hypothetical protein